MERSILKDTNPSTGEVDPARRYEFPDPTPVAPPVGYTKQPSMVEHIRNMVRSEMLRQAAEASELESFEEADDFDVGDDFDPTSPHEETFDPELGPSYDPGFAQAAVARQAASEAAASSPANPPSDGPSAAADSPQGPTQAPLTA